ncbi:MAG: hypothetical protein M1816_006400 [Peltula sp. TS41687]|nr:MAG: hypothetical protein M1816_006400 [Peltula sp. TS41687]
MSMSMSKPNVRPSNGTRILPVESSRIGQFKHSNPSDPWLDSWEISLRDDTPDAQHILEAAALLRTSSIPVAFPTETVYGLGADATRSEAVRGIYQAKQRPSDNPLIVHVYSLDQLRGLLRPEANESSAANGVDGVKSGSSGLEDSTESKTNSTTDPIPAIYHPLIRRFWPGPLTILLPNPPGSMLAREVTAGLSTFGARMPANPLALMLIRLAGVPLAAPSANASTKPSPTTAEHVREDLDGRIDVILDGGPCSVGVESTVVDGLTEPPAILRPGGISIEQIRSCGGGWEGVVVAYKDAAVATTEEEEKQNSTPPKAPGMKYRHYSPRAKVVLYPPATSAGVASVEGVAEKIRMYLMENGTGTVGLIRTKTWEPFAGLISTRHETTLLTSPSSSEAHTQQPLQTNGTSQPHFPSPSPTLTTLTLTLPSSNSSEEKEKEEEQREIKIWDIRLGPSTSAIARGIFSALRALDHESVEVIFVETIPDDDDQGDHLAAAIMNRLRKAAS